MNSSHLGCPLTSLSTQGLICGKEGDGRGFKRLREMWVKNPDRGQGHLLAEENLGLQGELMSIAGI